MRNVGALKTTMPYLPTEEEKLNGLDNVYYEILQLLGTMGPKIGDPTLDNAVLESRLVHVRTLLDFFARLHHEQDDVLAAHYGFPLSPIVLDPIFVDRLNKDLAHLTYSRTQRTMSMKGWPVAKVVVPTLSRCKEFIDYILTERSVFGQVGPTDWRVLALGIQAFLDSRLARQGV